MRKKSLITWKDADQNLCTIAAFIFHQAMVEIRNPDPPNMLKEPKWMSNGQAVPPSYASTWPRSVTSWGLDNDFMGWFGNTSGGPYGVVFTYIPQPSTLCWWCFQNIVRQRLREARLELKKNCYPQNRKRKTRREVHKTRNQGKRFVNRSKYGRHPERE